MAVRNFWIEADIDGRKTTLAGGPKGKDGNMHITIYQRSEGGIVEAVNINCISFFSGELQTTVLVSSDNPIESSVRTVR